MGHAKHWLEPTSSWYFPASHGKQVVELLAPNMGPYVPIWQFWHVVFEMAAWAVEYFPLRQDSHSLEAFMPDPLLYVPDEQFVHNSLE